MKLRLTVVALICGLSLWFVSTKPRVQPRNSEQTLTVYALYKEPGDFPPGTWVVRKWIVGKGQVTLGPVHGRTGSRDEAIGLIPASASPVPLSPNDDKTLVATWID